jgi:hypothetical protein
MLELLIRDWIVVGLGVWVSRSIGIDWELLRRLTM